MVPNGHFLKDFQISSLGFRCTGEKNCACSFNINWLISCICNWWAIWIVSPNLTHLIINTAMSDQYCYDILLVYKSLLNTNSTFISFYPWIKKMYALPKIWWVIDILPNHYIWVGDWFSFLIAKVIDDKIRRYRNDKQFLEKRIRRQT